MKNFNIFNKSSTPSYTLPPATNPWFYFPLLTVHVHKYAALFTFVYLILGKIYQQRIEEKERSKLRWTWQTFIPPSILWQLILFIFFLLSKSMSSLDRPILSKVIVGLQHRCKNEILRLIFNILTMLLKRLQNASTFY